MCNLTTSAGIVTTPKQRTAARRAAGAMTRYGHRPDNTVPVHVLPDADAAPELVGTSHHHVNKSGDLVRFPNAYRRAFGRPIYVHSTRRVIVGERWIADTARAAAVCAALDASGS